MSILNKPLHRVLLIRLRSIGDTVLMTPCLTALKNWQPNLEIDVLLESLSAPVLSNHPQVSKLFVLPKVSGELAKMRVRWQIIKSLRARSYDLAVNLHGGTTGLFLAKLSGAKKTLGYKASRYSSLLSLAAPSPEIIWQKEQIHCVEQQLGLLKWAGVDVLTPPPSNLAVDPLAKKNIEAKLDKIKKPFLLIHPAAAFQSKQWEAKNFAAVIEHIYQRYKIPSILAVAKNEIQVATKIKSFTKVPLTSFVDLDLSELMALIEQSSLFLGNDSGPAHIAAAFQKPVVVIFGSSNSKVWHPWLTNYKLLKADLPCIPCPGYTCSEFPEPECIKKIIVESVINALEELITTSLQLFSV
jgi:predicted lipopolysaccharide heptosyltransferase III